MTFGTYFLFMTACAFALVGAVAVVSLRFRRRLSRILSGLLPRRRVNRSSALPRTPASGAGDDGSLISLVLLLREPRDIDAAGLARTVTRAWGVDVAVDDVDADHVVLTYGDRLLLLIGGHLLGVTARAGRHPRNMENAPERVGDPVLRRAVREHRGWISVDVVLRRRGAPMAEVLAVVGGVVDALAGDDGLAIYSAATRHLNRYDAGVRAVMRGLADRPAAPEESGDRAGRLRDAVAQARDRLDEFVAAFEARADGDLFLALAPFREDGLTEPLWLRVTGIEHGHLFGRLDETPLHLARLRRAGRVRVRLDLVRDWIYGNDRGARGGFTIRAARLLRRGSGGGRTGG